MQILHTMMMVVYRGTATPLFDVRVARDVLKLQPETTATARAAPRENRNGDISTAQGPRSRKLDNWTW
jgi:hypothetical protein